MKKTIIIAILALVAVFGISGYVYSTREASARKGSFETTVVGGCEYLMCPSYYGHFVLSHKGNCTNTIHAYNQ